MLCLIQEAPGDLEAPRGFRGFQGVPARVQGKSTFHIFCILQFEKSKPMVTYLACFIVCDFEYEEKLTEIHKTKFRVYATPHQKERLKYALEIGANITDYFED